MATRRDRDEFERREEPPTLAERVRATNRPHVRLVEGDEATATVIFIGGEAQDPDEPEEPAE